MIDLEHSFKAHWEFRGVRFVEANGLCKPGNLRSILAILTTAVALSGCAEQEPRQDQIDFVGCPADGQTGAIDAPQGTPKIAVLDGVPAGDVAYYKGENSRGAFAPHGWNCRVWYGSSGSTLIVTPASINPPYLTPPRLSAPAIEVSSIIGGTSGRFSVAIYASRLFAEPAAGFIQRIKNEGVVPTSAFERVGPPTIP